MILIVKGTSAFTPKLKEKSMGHMCHVSSRLYSFKTELGSQICAPSLIISRYMVSVFHNFEVYGMSLPFSLISCRISFLMCYKYKKPWKINFGLEVSFLNFGLEVSFLRLVVNASAHTLLSVPLHCSPTPFPKPFIERVRLHNDKYGGAPGRLALFLFSTLLSPISPLPFSLFILMMPSTIHKSLILKISWLSSHFYNVLVQDKWPISSLAHQHLPVHSFSFHWPHPLL